MRTLCVAGLALMAGLTGLAAEPLPSLGISRPDLWRAAKAEMPGLKVPGMRCGPPLVLMHCTAKINDRVEVEVVETLLSYDLTEDFIYGMPGLVYSAGVALRYPYDVTDFVTFGAYCVAFLVAAGRVETAEKGFALFAEQFEVAAAAIEGGFGMSTDGAEPLLFFMEVMPNWNIVCRVSAQ